MASMRFGLLTHAAVLALAALLTLAPVASAQDDPGAAPSPVPTRIPPISESGRPDLYLEMPYDLRGYEPQIVMTRGQEHFAGLPADDPRRLALETMLDTVGADVEDMVSGYALVSTEELFSFVVGVRVDGVQPGTLLPAYMPILLADLEAPRQREGSVGGKDVTIVSSVGEEGEEVDLYVYDEGDTVWLVQGPTDVIETVLAGLPDPLADPPQG